LRAEGFSCNFDVLYGGLGIVFDPGNFFAIFGHQNPGSGLVRIRIGIQPKMLDPDPYQVNTDQQPWFFLQRKEANNQVGLQSGFIELQKGCNQLSMCRIDIATMNTYLSCRI
jgi:hypothetical protein